MLTLGLALLPPVGTSAADLYVATNGTATGPGSLAEPYSLATALSGAVGQPGDTFWLRGGVYALGHVDTQIHGAVGQPITFRQLPGEKARIDGSFTVWNSIGHVVFRDFELFSSNTNRLSSQSEAGLNPTDITLQIGIQAFAPNLSFINLVVHDQTADGIYLSQSSANCLVYGCLVYNNGWASQDNAAGHNIYVQGDTGMRTIAENLMFNSAGANLHAYEDAPEGSLYGVTVDGNLAFHAGALQSVRAYRDWIIGVNAPALNADSILFQNNLGYLQPGLQTLTQVEIGRQGLNGKVTLLGNYMPLGLLIRNWATVTCASNLFAPQNGDWIVDLHQTLAPVSASWDYGTYGSVSPTNQFRSNSLPCSFSEWQDLTGFDVASSCSTGRLHGTKVFVRPNLYELGRAHLIVYNWDNLDRMAVDVSTVLPAGTAYEVRDAQNFYAAPVASGVFHGELLDLPLTNLAVASPTAALLTPPSTGPTFNVFVLLPLSRPDLPSLQVALDGENVQLSWPANFPGFILQSTTSLAPGSTWLNVTNVPVVVGHRYTTTHPVSAGSRFYRLEAPM